jgi:cytoskeletal protein RodZ
MAVRKRRADSDTQSEAPGNVIEAPIVPRRLTVSEILRDRRIECRLDIDHVAQVLMIRPSVLADIEDGRFDQLPGPAYAVGFVRSYATYLGLDADALVLRFKAEVAEVARRPHLNFPLPLSDTRVPTGSILVICVLLAALTYGAWYYVSERHGQLTDIVPAVPDRLTHLLSPQQMKQEITGTQPAPQPTAAPSAASEATAPAPSADQAATAQAPAAPAPPTQTQASTPAVPATPVPAPSGTAAAPPSAAPAVVAGGQPAPGAAPAAPATDADGVPPVEDKASAPASQPSVPATPDLAQPAVADAGKTAPQSSYGAPAGQARIVLHANADSWIQVRDGQGNLLITRILKPGQTYNVPNQPGLVMVTGNAGGLDISVDGAAIPQLGGSGQVVRDVKLEPDRLLASKPRAN